MLRSIWARGFASLSLTSLASSRGRIPRYTSSSRRGHKRTRKAKTELNCSFEENIRQTQEHPLDETWARLRSHVHIHQTGVIDFIKKHEKGQLRDMSSSWRGLEKFHDEWVGFQDHYEALLDYLFVYACRYDDLDIHALVLDFKESIQHFVDRLHAHEALLAEAAPIVRDQPELVLLSPEVMAKRLEDLKTALEISDKPAADLLLKYTWLPLINVEEVGPRLLTTIQKMQVTKTIVYSTCCTIEAIAWGKETALVESFFKDIDSRESTEQYNVKYDPGYFTLPTDMAYAPEPVFDVDIPESMEPLLEDEPSCQDYEY